MKVFQTDHNGFLVGETFADPDPMDEGNWLIPGGCVEQEPPTLPDGQRAKFVSGTWVVVEPEGAPVVEVEARDPRTDMILSFPQLLIGLVTEGWITEADGNGWLVGVLPPSVEVTINLVPADQRFAARARATRPSEVLRLDPLVQMMSMAQGRSPEEVDDFCVRYATV